MATNDVLPIPWVIRSDKDTDFFSPIASGDLGWETLGSTLYTSSVRRPEDRTIIQRVSLFTNRNFPWEVMLFKNDFAPVIPTDADLDPTIKRIEFLAADGKQVAGAGLFRYRRHMLNVDYYNTDSPGRIHVGLVNRDALPYWGPKFSDYIVVEIQGITYS